MTLLLDSSIIIDLEKGKKETIECIKKLSKLHKIPAKIPFITYFECLVGIKNKSTKNKIAALEFLNKFEVLQTTKYTSELLADLKCKYSAKGVQLTLSALLIASQAIENNMLLITKDKDFNTIQELSKLTIK